MVTLSDIARISGENPNSRYIPITLNTLKKGSYAYFSRQVARGIAQGVTSFQVRVAKDVTCYPNSIVPIAGVIDHYRSKGLEFKSSRSVESHHYLSTAGMLSPYESVELGRQAGFTDHVWKFTPETHYDIVSGIMFDVQRGLEVEKGVLQGIELCLNEITDNVLNHSLPSGRTDVAPSGFVMAQVHDSAERIAITVFDAGQGILKSLSIAEPQIQSSKEAITKALEKGVTSGNGRGYGLWILDRIVQESSGSLEIVSGDSRFVRVNPEGDEVARASFSGVRQVLDGTTLVDFQLKTRKSMSLADVLGYEPVNLWLEQHEDELDENSARIVVKNESLGFGTRMAAREVRTLTLNLSKEFDGDVVLDFSGIDLISASYADELVAKLLQDSKVKDRLILANLNDECRVVIGEVVGR